jgi:hypothetical protein
MSNKTEFYRQCELRRKIGNDSEEIDIAWIPEKFAIEGKFLKIKDIDWVDGWKVVAVGARKPRDFVETYEQCYKHQRKVSDI